MPMHRLAGAALTISAMVLAAVTANAQSSHNAAPSTAPGANASSTLPGAGGSGAGAGSASSVGTSGSAASPSGSASTLGTGASSATAGAPATGNQAQSGQMHSGTGDQKATTPQKPGQASSTSPSSQGHSSQGQPNAGSAQTGGPQTSGPQTGGPQAGGQGNANTAATPNGTSRSNTGDQSNTNAQGKADQSSSGSSRAPANASSSSTSNASASASATVNLSTQQKTEIRNRVITNNAPRVPNVNFNINVGSVVPPSVHFAPVPPMLVNIQPAWRGFVFFLAGDEIVIVDPHTRHIVAVLVV